MTLLTGLTIGAGVGILAMAAVAAGKIRDADSAYLAGYRKGREDAENHTPDSEETEPHPERWAEAPARLYVTFLGPSRN